MCICHKIHWSVVILRLEQTSLWYNSSLWTVAQAWNPCLIFSEILCYVNWLVLFPVCECGNYCNANRRILCLITYFIYITYQSATHFLNEQKLLNWEYLSANHLPENVSSISLLLAGWLRWGMGKPNWFFFNFTIVTWAIGGKILSLG